MKQPPETNGVMDLVQEEVSAIRTKLDTICAEFIDSETHAGCDTFYIVSTYNMENVGAEINGDTAEFILSN